MACLLSGMGASACYGGRFDGGVSGVEPEPVSPPRWPPIIAGRRAVVWPVTAFSIDRVPASLADHYSARPRTLANLRLAIKPPQNVNRSPKFLRDLTFFHKRKSPRSPPGLIETRSAVLTYQPHFEFPQSRQERQPFSFFRFVLKHVGQNAGCPGEPTFWKAPKTGRSASEARSPPP